MVVCLEQGAHDSWSRLCHCHPIISCFTEIQNGFTFLVPAYPGCPAREAIKRVSMCCLSIISHNDNCRPLDVISLSEHYVVAIRSVDVKVDLSNVRRPTVRSTLHLLPCIQQHCQQQLSLLSQQGTWKLTAKGSDTLESFLSKVAFESNLRKKLSRTEHVLIVKVSFDRRKNAKVFMTHLQVFFRKSLSKATFERKLSSVSLALRTTDLLRFSSQPIT